MPQLSGVVTDEGQLWLVDRVDPNVAEVGLWQNVGWGTSATAAAVTDTAAGADEQSRLADETTDRMTHLLTNSAVTQPTADKLRLTFSLRSTSNRTVREVIVTNDQQLNAGPDLLLARITHTARTLLVGDRIAYRVDLLARNDSEG